MNVTRTVYGALSGSRHVQLILSVGRVLWLSRPPGGHFDARFALNIPTTFFRSTPTP